MGYWAMVIALVAGMIFVRSAGRAPSAAAATVTLIPVADTYVNASAPTTRYGTGGQLVADGLPVAQSFIRFDLRTVSDTVKAARLRVHVDDISNGATTASTSARRGTSSP